MKWSRCLCFCSCALAIVELANVAVGQSAEKSSDSTSGGYRVLTTYDIGSEGGWDYIALDAEGRRLFVTRSTRVMVVDADTGKSVGEIADTPGVHGVALVPELGRGFTSNGKANNVTIFDLKTLKAIGTIAVGENPDAIVFEPTTKRVFAMNGKSHDATAIDAATGTVLGRINLGGKPEFAVADGSGKLFVNLEDTSEVVVLDPKALTVTTRWPLSPGEEPSGLAIDVMNRRLFSGCGNKMMVVLDADTGKVLATPAIGEHVDATAFDPATSLAFSSNGDGTLTIVHEDSPSTYSVVQNVTTLRGARTMILDPKTHNVFLPTAKFEPVPEGEKDSRHPRQKMIPGSFRIIVVGR